MSADSTRPIAARWGRVAGGFTTVADTVAATQWDNPTPCEGWVARDVIAHLVGWIPGFLADGTALDQPAVAGLEPVDAWRAIEGGIQRALDDPATATSTFEHPRAGSHRLADAVNTFICADVLIHTWDLASATGQTVDLDAEAVEAFLAGFEATDEDTLVASGHYAPRVAVPSDATKAMRLLALSGREPSRA